MTFGIAAGTAAARSGRGGGWSNHVAPIISGLSRANRAM